jgi:large subunit ribosomal protein L12
MEYIYAAMLLNSAKKDVTEESITSIIKATGLTVDAAKVKSLVEALKDVNFDEVIKEASSVQVAAAPAAASSAPAAAHKEEKKEEKTEEEAAAGLGSLFG